MKILIPAPTYLPSRRANTIQVVKMAQSIQSLGHQVRILIPGLGLKENTSWEKLSNHYGLTDNLEFYWLPVKPSFRSYDYGYQVIRHFRKWQGDILYTRLPQAAALGSLMNVPTVFEVHDFPGGRMGPLLFKQFLKGRGACRLVLISQALREDLHRRIFPLPDFPFTLVAPDGVDLSRYTNIPSSLEARISLQKALVPQLSTHTFTVGYTGHLYEGRGIPLILDVAKQLSEINFLIVGGDPADVKDVKTEVSRRGLRNVILTGFIVNSKLPLYQAACDVLLMPYQHTIAASSGGNIAPYLSPLKLFEYLACGRVILSSDLPVLREVLHEQNAILLPPSDVHGWSTALRGIREDLTKQRALGKRAREDSEQYDWKSRAEKIFSWNLSEPIL